MFFCLEESFIWFLAFAIGLILILGVVFHDYESIVAFLNPFYYQFPVKWTTPTEGIITPSIVSTSATCHFVVSGGCTLNYAISALKPVQSPGIPN